MWSPADIYDALVANFVQPLAVRCCLKFRLSPWRLLAATGWTCLAVMTVIAIAALTLGSPQFKDGLSGWLWATALLVITVIRARSAAITHEASDGPYTGALLRAEERSIAKTLLLGIGVTILLGTGFGAGCVVAASLGHGGPITVAGAWAATVPGIAFLVLWIAVALDHCRVPPVGPRRDRPSVELV